MHVLVEGSRVVGRSVMPGVIVGEGRLGLVLDSEKGSWSEMSERVVHV